MIDCLITATTITASARQPFRCHALVKSSRWLLAGLALTLISGLQARGQRDLQEIPEPDPASELQQFEVADGFEVNLYAANPLLAKPIQMNFDAQGRLWIASSEVYPQIRPGQKANDKVLVLEDTDNDGTADKTTVFADRLLIPTGVLPGDGGCYVANSTELLHWVDSDGDGRSDRRQVVLSGFGTEDTHHILHTLRWGPDGALYMNQSIYIHSHIETPYGVKRMDGAGVWRFRPESLKLETFTLGLVNPWGHAWDRYGTSFQTDGAGGEGINYVFPGFVGVTSPGASRVVRGLNPGKPKLCGLEVVSGSHLPDAWQGNLITNDFRAHRVCRYQVTREGSGFRASELDELIKTSHVAFRPVDVKMGPDGAIYIADWYNPIIQHGEVDFRDPRRDHVHGRIWRVTAIDRPLVPHLNLTTQTTDQLIELVSSPEPWRRRHARRVLTRRDAGEVLPRLNHHLASLKLDDPTDQLTGLDLLWTYQALNHCPPFLVKSLLTAENPRIRAAATRVVYHMNDRLPDALQWLSRRVVDPDGQVRLEAVRALSQLRDPQACEIAMRALDHPVDRFLDFCLWKTARDLQDVWLPALKRGTIDFGGRASHLAFALEALQSQETAPVLLSLLDADAVDQSVELRATILSVLAQVGTPQHLQRVWQEAVESEDSRLRATLLEQLVQVGRRRGQRPSGDISELRRWLNDSRLSQPAREAAIRLAGIWKLSDVQDKLLRLAQNESQPAVTRYAAIEAIASINDPTSRSTLARLASQEQSPLGLRMRAAGGLLRVDQTTGVGQIAQLLAELPSDMDPSPLIDAVLRRKDAAGQLASALAERSISRDVAVRAVRGVQSSGRDEPALVAALSSAGKLSESPWQSLDENQLAKLVKQVRQQGDAAAGQWLYRRADLTCQQCHAIGGAGGQVGPDLSSLGGSAQPDYILESLLQPGKKIKENYHSLIVETVDGRVLTGIKVRESQDDLILRNADDQEIRVPLSSIDYRTDGGSLMPEGLVDRLTRTELVNLVRFLSELGKVGGGFTLPRDTYVRTWHVLQDTEANALALRGNGVQRAATHWKELAWQPVYSLVSGTLPLADLPHVQVGPGQRVVVLRPELDVATDEPLELELNRTANVRIWWGDEPIEAANQLVLDSSPSRRALTVLIGNPPQEGHAPESATRSKQATAGNSNKARSPADQVFSIKVRQ